MTKLPGTAAFNGGYIVNVESYSFAETTAQLPSFYRAKAVAKGKAYNTEITIARATVGALGTAVEGSMVIRAPVDTSKAITRDFYGGDNVHSHSRSTSESAWSSWKKVFDSENKPALADISDAGTAAAANIGTSGANVPQLNGGNTWSGTQLFNASATFTGAVLTSFTLALGGHLCLGDCSATIASGVAVIPFSANDGTLFTVLPQGGVADDLVSITPPFGVANNMLIYVYAPSGLVTIKGSAVANRIYCGSDIVMGANDVVQMIYTGSAWNVLAHHAN